MEIVPVGQEEDSEVVEVKSDIVKTAEEAQIVASVELLANLRQMVNEPAFSDVVFVCSDGKRVHGSRIILAGRSDVLKSLFMNGMAESHLSEITLPLISSPVLLSVFEFLYTGTLSDYQPQTWEMACEVVCTSRFFLLPKLEKITRKFMHAQTVSVAEDLPKAASLLTEAVRFKSLREEPDVNLKELVTILSSSWSNSISVKSNSRSCSGCVFYGSLSADAFHYLLGNSKSNCEYDNKLSFEEYRRFRLAIRWYVHRSKYGCRSAEEIVDQIVPHEKNAVSLCRELCRGDEVDTPINYPASRWNALVECGGKELRQTVSRLMSHIDCRRIHPILLTKVVEPMKIISTEQVLSSLRFHALRRTMIFSIPECDWVHGECSYRVFEPGNIIEKSGNKIGLAMATSAMSHPYGIYQWRFILEKGTISAEFGLMHFLDGIPDEKDDLVGKRLSAQDHARVLSYNGWDAFVNWAEGGGCLPLRELDKVHCKQILFNYNASEHTCSLSINHKDYGAIWKNLPSGTYYPAVCLSSWCGGRVRIELVSGFDII